MVATSSRRVSVLILDIVPPPLAVTSLVRQRSPPGNGSGEAMQWMRCASAPSPCGSGAGSCGLMIGDPYGIRTRVTCVKGGCPRPLDEGVCFVRVSPEGLEPSTLGLKGRCSTTELWALRRAAIWMI
jgi:hypothetical protein